ncbi:MAG: GNAT family N-acetyltransferase, partial [Rhizorhabdus sp.]
ARGYEPVPTYSAHFIPHPGFRRAVAEYLEEERRAIAANIEGLGDYTPFRKG